MSKVAVIVSLALLGAASSLADIEAVRSTLESALAEQREPRVSRADLVGLYADDIKNGSRDDVRALLALAQRCLRSRVKVAQEWGLIVFYLATFRADSSELIAPYVEGDIAPFLNDQDLAVKREAIFILGTTQPRLLPRALDLLSAHLADKDNTEMEAGMIAATLIHGCPTDPRPIHDVLDFVMGHPDYKLRANMINLLGLNNVTVDDAIKFIRGGLTDQSPEVRRISVEAVGHMPPESRAKFSGDLLQLLANPDEPEDVRATVQRVLQQ
jgi:hypothetical protein